MHSLRLLLAAALLVACGPRPHATDTPAPRYATRSRPAQGTLRLQTRAGGVLDFSLPPGGSTVTVQLAPGVADAPRTSMHFSQAALRRFVQDLEALARHRLRPRSSRDMWGVEVEDGAGELALHVTRVTRRTRDYVPRDSFAIAVRAAGGPLVLPLTEEELGDVTGIVRSYAAFLALMPEAPPGTARPHFDFEVDQPAMPARGGCSPRYPERLLVRGVTGDVRAEFVIGADGRVEPASFRALQATDSAFVVEIRRAVPCFRYAPARVGGQPVRVVATQQFTFDIARDDY